MREGLHSLSRGIVAGALLAVVLSLSGRYLAGSSAAYWPWAALVLGVSAGLIFGAWKRPTLLRAARQADRQRSLSNRLATAVELLDGHLAAGLMALQLADAATIATSLSASRAFPRSGLAARNAALLGGAVLVASTAALVLTSTPLSQSQRLSTDLTAVEAETSAADTPTQSEAAALPAAIARPRQLQQLRARSASEQAAIALLADQLKQTSSARDVGQALQRGDVAQASALLAQLAQESDQLSQPAKQELASALLNASRGTAALDKDLAAAELNATQAMTRSDYQAVRKGLQALAATVVTSQNGILTQQQLVQQIQELERQAATQGNGADCGVLTDDGEFFQDCSAVGQAMSSGAMGVVSRGVGQSPTAGVGEVAGGHGYATSGLDLDPLGQTPTHLDLPAADLPVDIPLSSAQGSGTPPDQKAPTVAISQSSQQDVTQLAGQQSSEPGSQQPERTVVGPAERAIVRDFFRASDGTGQ